MVSEVEDRIIGIGSGFEIEDYWKPGQKIRKMVSQPITPPAGVTPEIRILEKSQDFRGLIVKHSFSLRSRRGVRQKFAEGMLIWWVPKRLFCKLFLWSPGQEKTEFMPPDLVSERFFFHPDILTPL